MVPCEAQHPPVPASCCGLRVSSVGTSCRGGCARLVGVGGQAGRHPECLTLLSMERRAFPSPLQPEIQHVWVCLRRGRALSPLAPWVRGGPALPQVSSPSLAAGRARVCPLGTLGPRVT